MHNAKHAHQKMDTARINNMDTATIIIFRPISAHSPDPPRIPPSPMEITLDDPVPVPSEATLAAHPSPAASTADLSFVPHTPPATAAAECRAPPPKRKRRYRPPMAKNKMNSVLRCTNGQGMRIVLSIPDPGEECPLTLSPIADDELDFLPGLRFVLPLPDLTKLALPCGHGFGAMNILYHFARRDMRCPCCRNGFKEKLDTDCVPRHFRERFRARIERAAREDREELAASDEQIARALSIRTGPSLVDALSATPLSLSVYLHSSAAPDGPVTSLELSLVSNAGPDAESEFSHVRPHPNALPPRGVASFFLPIHGQRILNEQLRDGTVTSMSFVVHTRSFTTGGNVIELARAGPIPVRECTYDVTRVVPTANGTYFDISTRHNPFYFQCLVWRLPFGVRPPTSALREVAFDAMIFVID